MGFPSCRFTSRVWTKTFRKFLAVFMHSTYPGQKSIQNLGATSKFQAPERQYKTISILKPHKYYTPPGRGKKKKKKKTVVWEPWLPEFVHLWSNNNMMRLHKITPFSVKSYSFFCYFPSRGSKHFSVSVLNLLTPNDPYMGRTVPLTSKRCILYIYSTNIGTEYFKHALYSPLFFSSKCSLFHNVWFLYYSHFIYRVC